MQDYKELYLKMARASEQAVCTLIQAQQECEQLYLSSNEPKLMLVPFETETKPDDQQEK